MQLKCFSYKGCYKHYSWLMWVVTLKLDEYTITQMFSVCVNFFAKRLQSRAIFHFVNIVALSGIILWQPLLNNGKNSFLVSTVHKTVTIQRTYFSCMCRDVMIFFKSLFLVAERPVQKHAECWSGCGMSANFTGHLTVMCDFIGTKWFVHALICIDGNLLVDNTLLSDHARRI